MDDIPIYVINLKRSTLRLKFIGRQLDAIKRYFERVEAVDGSNIPSNEVCYYHQKSKHKRHYSDLNKGEIGCSISWQNVWKKISKHNVDACVVLEDDIRIHANFDSTISALFNNIDKNIVIDLSGKKGFLISERKTVNGIKLIRYQTPPLRNQGGIYGKNAAKNLVNKVSCFSAPIDTLRQMIWLHGVRTWSLEDGCVSHCTKDVGGSTIQVKKKKPIEKIKKELIRPFWRLYIIARNFLYQY
jgi:GR25 family glycosyltransferase involved in LPS biosynthesis